VAITCSPWLLAECPLYHQPQPEKDGRRDDLSRSVPRGAGTGYANLVETAIKIAFANASVARQEPARGRNQPPFIRAGLSFPMRMEIQRETCDD
jgi:hypothetical protein